MTDREISTIPRAGASEPVTREIAGRGWAKPVTRLGRLLVVGVMALAGSGSR